MQVRQYLKEAAEEILKSLPNPFGSFEKAKYEVYKNKKTGEPVYRFTTTTRNEEECLGIMVDKFLTLDKDGRKFTVYKYQGGIETIIYTSITE